MVLQLLVARYLGTGRSGSEALVKLVALALATAVISFAASLAWGRLGLRKVLG